MRWPGSATGRPRKRRRKHGRRLTSATPAPKAHPKRRRKTGTRRAPMPLMRIRWKRPGRRTLRLAGGLALGIAAFFGGRVAMERLAVLPSFAVREIEVRGIEHADLDEILALAAVLPGEPWIGLDRATVRFRVQSHPWVQRARIHRPWVGRVRIQIQECRPIARIHVDGRKYGLCEDLRIVPDSPDQVGLPVIRDFGSGRAVDSEALARGVEYVRALREFGLDGTLVVDLRRGTGDRIELPDVGFAIEVERRIPAAEVARNAAAFLEKLDGEGGARGTLRLISEGTAVWTASA